MRFSTLEVRANRARPLVLFCSVQFVSFSTLEVRANRASDSRDNLNSERIGFQYPRSSGQSCKGEGAGKRSGRGKVSVPSKFGPIVQGKAHTRSKRRSTRFSTLEVRANRARMLISLSKKMSSCFSTLEVRANRASWRLAPFAIAATRFQYPRSSGQSCKCKFNV